jgi:hypothetical protein
VKSIEDIEILVSTLRYSTSYYPLWLSQERKPSTVLPILRKMLLLL